MTVEKIKKDLIRKGHKKVDQYMRNRGYCLYDCIETDTGYEAEYYFSHAGVTVKKVFIVYNKNWRVVDVK